MSAGALVVSPLALGGELGVPVRAERRYLLAWREGETAAGMLRLTLQHWTEQGWADEDSAECEVPPAAWEDEGALMPLVRDLAARLAR